MEGLGTHIKNLQNERQQRYRKKHRTFSLCFHNEKACILSREAHRQGMKEAEYLKALFEASLKTSYVLPKENMLKQLVLEIRQIANTMNTLTRIMHGDVKVAIPDLERLQGHLNDLEGHIKKALTSPPTLPEFLNKEIENTPEKLTSLLEILQTFINDHKIQIS